jgi:uncharacterized protein YacL
VKLLSLLPVQNHKNYLSINKELSNMTDIMITTFSALGVLLVVLAILRLRHVSMQSLILGLAGAILGLMLGALASVPLSKLPEPFGSFLPIVVSIALTLILMTAALARRRNLQSLWPFGRTPAAAPVAASEPEAAAERPAAPVEPQLPPILVDTSVIIDGRIADIGRAGFVPGRLVVPRFVLAELQNIADSDDAMRRGRGRRGLDVLNQLREMPGVEVEIIDDDVAGIREVDAKLVVLAQKFSCNVLTTDYNLNRVAQIQGVRVLNVNELSNAIRPVVLPGEELTVRVVQPGKERNQGVGYLADGTMIVVENGDKLIGQEVVTEVTRVFQTVAGKMIFAAPKPGHQPAPVVDTVKPEPAPTAGDSREPGRGNSQRGRFNRQRKPDKDQKDHQNGRHHPSKPNSLEDRVIAATNQVQPQYKQSDQ